MVRHTKPSITSDTRSTSQAWAPNQVATVYDGQWFFAFERPRRIKKRSWIAPMAATSPRRIRPVAEKDRQSTLEADDAFRGAMKHMPTSYGLLLYLQPKALSETLASCEMPSALPPIRTMWSIKSTAFARRRDSIKEKFATCCLFGMPKAQSAQN